MKRLFVFLTLTFALNSFSQSKKEQITALNKRVDSLNAVLSATRYNASKESTELTKEINVLKWNVTKLENDNVYSATELEKLKTEVEKLKTEKQMIFERGYGNQYLADLLFVHNGLLVLTDLIDIIWAKGDTLMLSKLSKSISADGGGWGTYQEVDTLLLPKSVLNLKDSVYYFHTGSETIKGKIKKFYLIRFFEPHDGDWMRWNNYDNHGITDTLQIMREVHNYSDIPTYLVASFDFFNNSSTITPGAIEFVTKNKNVRKIKGDSFNLQKHKGLIRMLASHPEYGYNQYRYSEEHDSNDNWYEAKGAIELAQEFTMSNGDKYYYVRHDFFSENNNVYFINTIWKGLPKGHYVECRLANFNLYESTLKSMLEMDNDSAPALVCQDLHRTVYLELFEGVSYKLMSSFSHPVFWCGR